MNQMFYNPLFEFETILEDPSNASSILELCDDVMGKEIYSKDIADSDYSSIKEKFYFLHAIRHIPFLPTNTRQVTFAMECQAMKTITCQEFHASCIILKTFNSSKPESPRNEPPKKSSSQEHPFSATLKVKINV